MLKAIFRKSLYHFKKQLICIVMYNWLSIPNIKILDI